MPTYEYECLECKSRFEIFQRMNDQPIKKCLKCNGNMKRLIGAGAGLIFKGSGFYITDYKNNKNHSTTSENKEKSALKKDSKKESTNKKSDQQDNKKAS